MKSQYMGFAPSTFLVVYLPLETYKHNLLRMVCEPPLLSGKLAVLGSTQYNII